MKANEFDYIICGGGASGLLLLKELLTDPYFESCRIALIEKEEKIQTIALGVSGKIKLLILKIYSPHNGPRPALILRPNLLNFLWPLIPIRCCVPNLFTRHYMSHLPIQNK